MSRLDSFIARMQAQRDCLNFLKPRIDALPGPILEVGLGNGRTYDHLRDLFPGRDIYVFERKVAAHPDCIPPDDRLFVGEAREAIPKAAQKLGATAALIHTDLGTGDHAANTAMGQWLGPALDALVGPGGYVLANQPLDVARWHRQPDPPGVPKDRYFLYQVLDHLRRHTGKGYEREAQRLNSLSSTSRTTAPTTEPMKPAGSPGA